MPPTTPSGKHERIASDVGGARRCVRCILPETFPRVRFDTNGVCGYCNEAPAPEEMTAIRARLGDRMDAVVQERRGSGVYDCIVAFSGGKDSSYTLDMLVGRYGLNCLAITIDNGFIADTALENCHRVTKALGVDFVLFAPSPSFMQNMYRRSAERAGIHAAAAIKRASNICNSCINLINNQMLVTALEKQVPIIAGGYIGGQVPKDAAVIDIDLRAHAQTRAVALRKYAEHFGEQASRYFGVDATLLERSPIQRVAVLNPMLTVAVSEEEIVDTIARLGWVRPTDTGQNSSNCRLNDLGIAVHHRRHGFNPYVAELAEQVRYGLMDRDAALRKAEAIPSADDVRDQAASIGISLDDVR